MFIKVLFFISLFMILYVYLGYPVLIAAIGSVRKHKVDKNPVEPEVTILIAAYNEEENIKNTLKNKLKLDYPKGKMEIIVISDCSTDRTDEIVKEFEPNGVRLIRQEPRAGKTAALNLAVPKAKGEILAFSDANSIWAEDALQLLVRNFADTEVGYVTGKMIYTNLQGSPVGDGCTAYMRYENLLRRYESLSGSIVGVDGGIDAMRKNLYRPMTSDQLSDFVLPLHVIDRGYRVVYESAAILKEQTLVKDQDEYRMRVRVVLRSLWALWDMKHLLISKKNLRYKCEKDQTYRRCVWYLLYSWQLWSHKVLRYLCFVFMLCAYITNLILWRESCIYASIFLIQNKLYLMAVLSSFINNAGFCRKILTFVHYFILLNLACANACVKFLLNQKQVTWSPRKG